MSRRVSPTFLSSVSLTHDGSAAPASSGSPRSGRGVGQCSPRMPSSSPRNVDAVTHSGSPLPSQRGAARRSLPQKQAFLQSSDAIKGTGLCSDAPPMRRSLSPQAEALWHGSAAAECFSRGYKAGFKAPYYRGEPGSRHPAPSPRSSLGSARSLSRMQSAPQLVFESTSRADYKEYPRSVLSGEAGEPGSRHPAPSPRSGLGSARSVSRMQSAPQSRTLHDRNESVSQSEMRSGLGSARSVSGTQSAPQPIFDNTLRADYKEYPRGVLSGLSSSPRSLFDDVPKKTSRGYRKSSSQKRIAPLGSAKEDDSQSIANGSVIEQVSSAKEDYSRNIAKSNVVQQPESRTITRQKYQLPDIAFMNWRRSKTDEYNKSLGERSEPQDSLSDLEIQVSVIPLSPSAKAQSPRSGAAKQECLRQFSSPHLNGRLLLNDSAVHGYSFKDKCSPKLGAIGKSLHVEATLHSSGVTTCLNSWENFFVSPRHDVPKPRSLYRTEKSSDWTCCSSELFPEKNPDQSPDALSPERKVTPPVEVSQRWRGQISNELSPERKVTPPVEVTKPVEVGQQPAGQLSMQLSPERNETPPYEMLFPAQTGQSVRSASPPWGTSLNIDQSSLHNYGSCSHRQHISAGHAKHMQLRGVNAGAPGGFGPTFGVKRTTRRTSSKVPVLQKDWYHFGEQQAIRAANGSQPMSKENQAQNVQDGSLSKTSTLRSRSLEVLPSVSELDGLRKLVHSLGHGIPDEYNQAEKAGLGHKKAEKAGSK